MRRQWRVVRSPSAVGELVHDGDVVALEGFTHLIPHAAGHELIRQGRRELTLVRMTPDVVYDQMIGMGCARKLVFSWGGNPGVGSLHRFRDAVEHGWPAPLELEEHSHAGMAAALRGRGVEPALRRAPRATRGARPRRTARLGRECHLPVHGRGARGRAGAPARRRRSSTRSRPTGTGTSSCGASLGVQKETVLASQRSIVTVEEIVDELEPRPGGDRHPVWVVDAVALAPGGAHPSYAHGYYDRDNDFYVAWDAISRDRDRVPGLDAAARARRPADVVEYRRASLRRSPPERDTDLHGRRDDGRRGRARRLARRRWSASSASACPSLAANLARAYARARDCVLVYESGTIGAKPTRLPLSIGDGELAETADAGRLGAGDLRLLAPGRPHRRRLPRARRRSTGTANLNSTVIGDVRQPQGALPGRRAARPEIATSAQEVFVMLRQSLRDRSSRELDFRTSGGRLGRAPSSPTSGSSSRGRGAELTLTSRSPGRRASSRHARRPGGSCASRTSCGETAAAHRGRAERAARPRRREDDVE